MLLGIGERPLDPIRLGLELEQGRMLRLAAGAAMVEHQLLRHPPCQIAAQILLDHPERQVDAGAHPGRGPCAAVGDEDPVHLDPDPGIARLQCAGIGPVGRRPPAVEQAGLGQHEGAGTDRGHAPHRPRRLLQAAKQAGTGRPDDELARDDERVVALRADRRGIDRHAERGAHRAACLRQHVQVVERPVAQQIGAFERRQRGEAHDLERRHDNETGASHGSLRLESSDPAI